MSNTIKVFGHKNPDTDAIAAAISFSYLQNRLDYDTEPVALGQAGEETLYALDRFGFDHPPIVEKIEQEGEEVMLVDHNERQQSIDGIEQATVLAVVDHHRIANFETSDPLFFRAEPVGCTSTIIYKLFRDHHVDLPQDIAGLMLSAIISDTLLFKSPTSTPQDETIARQLAEIAGVDLEAYGLDMLKAGTNVDHFSEEEILEGDAKSFDMGDVPVRIGQVNVVDIDDVLKRKDKLIQEMNRLATENNYDLYLLVITNILESSSHGLVVGSYLEQVEEAFGQDLSDNEIELKGIVSRKKQVVPALTESIQANQA